MKKIVIFTGAGISADSGIATFRDSNGLWAKHRVEDVCTPEALLHNRKELIDFYNSRRKELLSSLPNAAHRAILKLAEKFEIEVVTQNIDDLHERAAKELNLPLKVTHLHGELRMLRSSIDEEAIVPIEGWEQDLNARHSDGSLLRPFVVFFGESVPMLERAAKIVESADIFIIVGTSLAVYPAASLVNYLKRDTPIYLVDPATPNVSGIGTLITHIKEGAAVGMPGLVDRLIMEGK